MKCTAAIVLVALLSAGPAATADTQTLVGSFDSSYQDRPERLRAVFTPKEEDQWSVVFYFRFGGAEHAYAGVASGSLSDGQLAGRAENETGARTFTFRGAVREGEFEGSHFELLRGRERKTGSLRLAR